MILCQIFGQAAWSSWQEGDSNMRTETANHRFCIGHPKGFTGVRKYYHRDECRPDMFPNPLDSDRMEMQASEQQPPRVIPQFTVF